MISNTRFMSILGGRLLRVSSPFSFSCTARRSISSWGSVQGHAMEADQTPPAMERGGREARRRSILPKMYDTIPGVTKIAGNNLRKSFLINKFYKILNDSECICVAQYNDMDINKRNRLAFDIKKHGFEMASIKRSMINKALEGSPFEEFSTLHKSTCVLIYAKEPTNLGAVLKMLKKDGTLTVVGLKFLDRIVHHESMKTYTSMPSLDVLRGQLVSILSSPASTLSSRLAANPQRLAMLLQSLSEGNDKKGEDEEKKE